MKYLKKKQTNQQWWIIAKLHKKTIFSSLSVSHFHIVTHIVKVMCNSTCSVKHPINIRHLFLNFYCFLPWLLPSLPYPSRVFAKTSHLSRSFIRYSLLHTLPYYKVRVWHLAPVNSFTIVDALVCRGNSKKKWRYDVSQCISTNLAVCGRIALLSREMPVQYTPG